MKAPRTGKSFRFVRACVRAVGCHSESDSQGGALPVYLLSFGPGGRILYLPSKFLKERVLKHSFKDSF